MRMAERSAELAAAHACAHTRRCAQGKPRPRMSAAGRCLSCAEIPALPARSEADRRYAEKAVTGNHQVALL